MDIGEEICPNLVVRLEGIEDTRRDCGIIEPQGIFIVAYYSLSNRANQTLQVGRIGHNYFVLTDDRGWQWEVADYSDYGFNCYIHVNAADARPRTGRP